MYPVSTIKLADHASLQRFELGQTMGGGGGRDCEMGYMNIFFRSTHLYIVLLRCYPFFEFRHQHLQWTRAAAEVKHRNHNRRAAPLSCSHHIMTGPQLANTKGTEGRGRGAHGSAVRDLLPELQKQLLPDNLCNEEAL